MTLEKLIADVTSKPAKDPAADLRTLRDAFVKRAGRINEYELAKFSNLAVKLLGQVALIERMAFARQLAKHRSTPQDLLTLLANDHYLVSAPVLESAPMLEEAELVDIIGRFGAPVCLAIAKRDELSVGLTDLLMSDAEHKVQYALAENTGARLSRKSMAALCDLAEANTDMHVAMSRRRDLPHALAGRLKSVNVAGPDATTASPGAEASGRGRAGIVLSANLLNPKSKPKAAKAFSYS